MFTWPEFGFDFPSVLFYTFALLCFIQLFYHLYFHTRLAFYKFKKNEIPTNAGVSVIIAARNELQNLEKYLPLILNQDYPEFEVIVVNNQSVDDSIFYLKKLKTQFPKLKIVEMERTRHLGTGKKIPLSLGIKAASFEHLLFIDADCEPASDKWLFHMASKFSTKKEIVLGYGPYRVEKGLLNKIIRFDTAWIALSYMSLAMGRIPYMGVGRNLAYGRKAWDRVKGFKSHHAIQSGDDDLFVQEAAGKQNYTVQLNPESFTYSRGKSNFSDWTLQKSRHYSTSPKYSFFKKIMLGLYPMSVVLSWATGIYLISFPSFLLISITIFGSLMLVKWIIIGLSFRKLKETGFVLLIPFLDLFYSILSPILYFSLEKSATTRWK